MSGEVIVYVSNLYQSVAPQLFNSLSLVFFSRIVCITGQYTSKMSGEVTVYISNLYQSIALQLLNSHGLSSFPELYI